MIGHHADNRSLTDGGKNFCPKCPAHEMAERSDIEDFFREIDPDLCQYAYAFRESGFASNIIVFVDGENFEFSD